VTLRPAPRAEGIALRSGALALVAALSEIAACRPDLGPSDSLVTSPRVLAVKAEPAEAKPGVKATYTALVGRADDAGTNAPLIWHFCVAPKPLTENDSVSTVCIEDASANVAAGSGTSIEAATARNACALFGPDTAPGGFRPRDPDVTGGYYQPLLIDGIGSPVLYLTRILCNLADAPIDVAQQFAGTYVANANPHLGLLVARVGGNTASLAALPAGARVELEARWTADDAETYAFFDRSSQVLATKREALRVAWFASAGALDTESSGRAEDDLATTSQNGWLAPALPGTARIWVVLRDSRGGVDFATFDATLVP
jgi:hypothetical protein